MSNHMLQRVYLTNEGKCSTTYSAKHLKEFILQKDGHLRIVTLGVEPQITTYIKLENFMAITGMTCNHEYIVLISIMDSPLIFMHSNNYVCIRTSIPKGSIISMGLEGDDIEATLYLYQKNKYTTLKLPSCIVTELRYTNFRTAQQCGHAICRGDHVVDVYSRVGERITTITLPEYIKVIKLHVDGSLQINNLLYRFHNTSNQTSREIVSA